MSSEQPFQHLFESLGRLPQSHADAINQPAYQALLETLTVPLERAGRCILLRAPRAGYGKTHLLSRLQHHLTSGHEFIPLHPATGCRVDAVSVTDDTLRRIGRPLPAGGGLCGLDLIVRRLFSLALEPLVISGEVPCLDREGALSSLRYRPVETFDFHHPNAVTARWIRDNFEVLGPRLALELAQLTGASPRAVGFWVELMFRFAATPVEAPGRIDALAQAALVASPGDGVAMERLSALLNLVSLMVRVVLVGDDLEGFSADETAALRLAAFLSSLRQSAERVDVILALNRDVWDSAFVPRLSGGLVDRLSEVVIELEPLTEAQMVAILDSRTPGLGARVLDYMRADGLEPYARGLLRAAGAAWLRALREGPPAAAAPVAAPAPETPAASPVGVQPEPPAWLTPISSAPPEPPPVPQFSPLAPASEDVPPPSGVAGAASSPFTAVVEPPLSASPFSAPAVGSESAHPSTADWHEVTGPTAPFDAAPDPAQAAPPIDQERVDDLLRQFRERYSRPTP